MTRAGGISRAAIGLLAAGVLSGSLACASSVIKLDTLPDDAIAVRLWGNEEARLRRDMLAEFEKKSRAPQRLGMMELGDVFSPSRSPQDRDPSDRYPGRLALINPRTTEVTFPEEVPPGARPLSWSADRERLIFSSDRPRGRFRIYELDFRSGEVKPLAVGSGNFLAAAHGAGSGMAYGAIQLGRDGEVESKILYREQGSRDRVLAEGVAIRHIASSPDRRRVAYAPQEFAPGAPRSQHLPLLVVQEVKPGGSRKELVPGLHPVFSPNGEWLVYSARRGDQMRTYRVRIDGSGRTAVGVGVRNEETPAISPDGGFIVYVSEHNGLGRLFVKRFDGTGDRLLYDGAAVEWPIW